MTVLDAGVVIALGDTTDAHHAASQMAVRGARTAGEQLRLPASALAEVLVGPIRTAGEAAGVERVQRLLDLLGVDVVPLDAEVAIAAASLRAQHGKRVPLPDALVVATAHRLQAQVLTTDAKWPPIPQVPVTVVAAAAKTRSARPRHR